MANELEKALADKIGNDEVGDELTNAMSALLIILLKRIGIEDDDLAEELTKRIKDKYPNPNITSRMMPSPS